MKALRWAGLAVFVFALALPAHAADITQEVGARLVSAEVVRGRFDQVKTMAGFPRPLVSQGDFLLWRDRGLIWLTRAPFPAQLVLTRNQLSASTGGARQQFDTTREPAMKMVNQMFLALLAGDLTALRQRFSISGETIGKNGWRLDLIPTEAAVAQRILRIEIAGDRHVRQVKLKEANGDSTSISFSALAEAPPPTTDEARQLGH